MKCKGKFLEVAEELLGKVSFPNNKEEVPFFSFSSLPVSDALIQTGILVGAVATMERQANCRAAEPTLETPTPDYSLSEIINVCAI